MLCKTLSTKEFSPLLHAAGSAARLRCYCRESLGGRPLPAVLLLPGGGYARRGESEAEPAALTFLAEGFQAFVLEYSLAPERHPRQLLEAAAALAFIKQRAGEFFVEPESVAVCGFSAGGHLSGMLANLWAEDFVSETLGGPRDAYRPGAAVLCYPFISTSLGGGLLENIGVAAGTHPKLSLEASVTENTPPCFLWHTADDPMVSVRHSLLMAEALREKGIPFELHVYGHGPHIMSVATGLSAITPAHADPHVATWTSLCAEWLHTVLGGGSVG